MTKSTTITKDITAADIRNVYSIAFFEALVNLAHEDAKLMYTATLMATEKTKQPLKLPDAELAAANIVA